MNRRQFIAYASAASITACTDGSAREQADDTATSGVASVAAGVTPETPSSSSPAASLPPATAGTTAASPSPWSPATVDLRRVEEFVASTNGRSLVMVQAGRVVHEWHRGGVAATFDVASVQKSVLSMLVGSAIERQLLSIDTVIDDVLGAGWARGESSQIQVLHVLAMTSGLDDARRVIDAPGRAWRYNSAFSVLADVIERVADGPLDEVAHEWLHDAAGAGSAAFRRRRAGTATVPTGLFCDALALASIGSAMLGDTSWRVDPAWRRASWTSSQTFNPSYGRLWWLNGAPSHVLPEGITAPGPLVPSAPVDMVAALGYGDQKLYILPSSDAVVVRLGGAAAPGSALALSGFDDELWALLTRR